MDFSSEYQFSTLRVCGDGVQMVELIQQEGKKTVVQNLIFKSEPVFFHLMAVLLNHVH